MKYGFYSDVGKLRKTNEDAFYVPDGNFDLPLFMVADGMGGHQAGDVASRVALSAMVDFFKSQPDDSYKLDMSRALRQAIRYSNLKVFMMANNASKLTGMGTTMAAVVFHNDRMYVAHIGDSRVYVHRDGKLLRITEDHSLVAELVKNGKLTEEEARNHPQRNIITRAIGTERDVLADIIEWPVKPGDIVLLCTDGLTGLVSDAEIFKHIDENKESPQTAAENLVKLANEMGGYDNITVVVINTINNTGEGKQ